MLILNYKRMKNDFLKFSSRKLFFSAMLVTALSAGASLPAFAGTAGVQSVMQAGTVKGLVVDATGESVIGASVLEKGTTNGVITDIDGNFTLNVSSPNAVVVISYIGYKTVEIPASDTKAFQKIVMREDSEVLAEVVVVGYGSQKKETLTGAVTVVDDKMLKDKGALSSPAQALQGQVPGVVITRNSAAPGDESWNMKLRGSFSKNNSDPLVIIDGVESESFSQLNPADIESINFLKDASAAIYGSKAAGGVILIQTKKAKAGKAKVEYGGSVTAKFVGLQPELMTLDQWCNAVTQARLNDGYKPEDDTWLQYTALAQANKGHYIDLDNTVNPFNNAFTDVADFVFFDTDWQNILWGTAMSTSHELSVSGGGEKTTYRLSGRYMYDDSNLKWGNNNNQRYNLRLNNTFHVTDKFDIESVLSFFRQDQVAPTQVGSALTASTQQPGFPSSTTDGKPYAWGTWGAPNWYCELGGDNKLKVTGINISEMFKYTFNEHFNAVATLGYNTNNATRDIQRTSIDWYNYAGTKKVMTNPQQEESNYIKSNSQTDLYTLNAYANWSQTFADKHDIAVMLGTQYSFKEYDYTTTKAKNILPSLDIINGIGEVTLVNDNNKGPEKWQEALLSYFARVNYDYLSKYLLEGNFRYDGSSKFQPENRWAFFWGVSAGWRLSEEALIKNLNIFDDLKLRVSYGTVGNQGGIDRYDGIQLYNFNQNKGALIGGEKISYIDTNGKLLSMDREWETIQNYNVGLDFGLFGNRLKGTAELFWKVCENMLIDVSYPATLGDKAPTANVGSFKANGFEGNLNWSDKIGKVGYSIGGTFTYTTNKLTDNGGSATITDGVRSDREGYPLNSVFGLKYAGKIRNEEQLEKYLYRYTGNNTIDMPTNLRLGDNMYEDVNGDGKLTEEDYVYLGTDDPKISFSFNGGLNWNGFDFSVVFQGVGERTIWRTGSSNKSNDAWRIPVMKPHLNSPNFSVGDVWSPENPGAYYPTYTNVDQINTYNYSCSSWSVENGNYLRLKNISLGYTFPAKWLEKTKFLTYARVYVTGSDLWETSKIRDGWDPEASREVTAYGRYPFTRNVTFGLNLTF